MIKFKCTSSGNIYEFEHEHDIQAMRKHPDYIEVVEQESIAPKIGRPKKIVEELGSVEEE
jgi:hypothetical protein